jgi:hypothetical protein
MRKIFVVATREFLETVKTRAFFIGVILMPAFIVGAIFLSNRITRAGGQEKAPLRRIAVIDEHGAVFEPLRGRVAEHNAKNPNTPLEASAFDGPETIARERVRAFDLYAYIVVPSEAVTGHAPCRLGRSDSQLMLGKTISRLAEESVKDARFAAADPPIDRKRVDRLLRDLHGHVWHQHGTADERAGGEEHARGRAAAGRAQPHAADGGKNPRHGRRRRRRAGHLERRRLVFGPLAEHGAPDHAGEVLVPGAVLHSGLSVHGGPDGGHRGGV